MRHSAYALARRCRQSLGRVLIGFAALAPAMGLGVAAPIRAAAQENANPQVELKKPGLLVEIRAMSISASDWASPDPARCRARIETIFRDVKRGGFNVVFFQAREGAETFYPSEREPWSARLAGKDPGFNPLKLAVALGHENGIHVYAGVDAMSLGRSDGSAVSTQPPRLLATHGPDAADSWICRDDKGAPIARDGKFFLSPGIPEVQAYLRKTITEMIAANPDLDGIYLTDVAYPDPEGSHDAISLRRFHERGNPNLDFWDDWQRAQLTGFLTTLYAEVRGAWPDIAVAVATPEIYSRSRFGGNATLPDAYHDHCMDPKAWVEAGAVDFVVPQVTRFTSTVAPAGEPTYQALVEDLFDLYTEPRMVIGLDLGGFKPGSDLEGRLRYPLTTGGLGAAALSYESVAKADAWDALRQSVFSTSVLSVPVADAKRSALGGLLVRVLDSKGQPVADAQVKLDGVETARVTSGDGLAAFLDVAPGEPMLHVEYIGAPAVHQKTTVAAQQIGEASVRLAGVEEVSPVYLAILDPADGAETTDKAVNVLGRTWKAKSATVNGVVAPILSTNLFVRDRIPLTPGKNTIQVVATGEDGSTARRTLEVTRLPEPTPTPLPPTFPLFIDKESVEPDEETRIAPGEPLHVAFTGAPGNIAEYRLPWTDWMPMKEATLPGTFQGNGHYGATRAFVRQEDAPAGNLEFRLRVPDDRPTPPGEKDIRQISTIPNHAIGLYGREVYRLLRIREEVGHLLHGLHSVRLGGPYLAEVPRGTLLHATGRRGDYFHVQLSADLDAWVPLEEIENEGPTTPPPHLSFTSISIQGDDRVDTVTIPYDVPVPFRVTPVVRAGQPAALEIDFFHAHDAATWISHRPTAKEVRMVTTEQVAEDHLRVRAELRSEQIWGYNAEVVGNSLRVVVRRPPVLAAAPASPLQGLTVGIEAGHGGSNYGAIGVSGTPEKYINRWTADALMKALEAKGASVVDCRIDDEAVALDTRIRRAENANADLFISIHANSASQARGYLRVSGTSTYYKWPFDYTFSEAIHARLLEKTGLGDFGNVGNFNYTPLRTTWMPAMLVEQAFMSNPEDEAKMLDPVFRQTMVDAIAQGAEDFLRDARK